MQELSKREDIIITKVDKGVVVAIVTVKDYMKEAKRQLNNTKNYRTLEEDPTTTNMKLENDITESLKKQKIKKLEKIAEDLKINDPQNTKTLSKT